MRLKQAGWSEERAQKEIAANANLIGLTGTWHPAQEHVQGGGRVDILFTAPGATECVIVEVQRNNVDRDHLTKVLEYLGSERVSKPSLDCRGVLVAEDFDGAHGRLAEAIARVAPLRLFRMSIHRDGSGDTLRLAEHYPPNQAAAKENNDRESWWRSRPWFPVAEVLFQTIIEIDPEWSPKFNKSFIGGKRNGGHFNSLALHDQGIDAFRLELKLDRSGMLDQQIEQMGFPIVYRNTGKHKEQRRCHYSLVVSSQRNRHDLSSLHGLLIEAHKRWHLIIRRGAGT